MQRRNFNKKEQDLIQKLKRENELLKKKISKLRKQIARIDLDRYNNLKDLLEKCDEEGREERLRQEQQRHIEKWLCHKCENGLLKLVIITRKDGTFYFRKCNNCPNRTGTQKYHSKVEGIK